MLPRSWPDPRRLLLRRTNSNDSWASAGALLPAPPVPSPTLPSKWPRYGKNLSRADISRALYWLVWLFACLALFFAAGRIVSTDQGLERVNYISSDGIAYQVSDTDLPKEPSPVRVTDQRGRSKWTISIPPTLEFPLNPEQYAGLCKGSKDISHQLAMERMPDSQKDRPKAAHPGYYHDDPHFMDVADAESHHMLPGVSWGQLRPDHCDRSLTYALETSSAGLGKTLLSLWLAYGLAQLEHRAFFIDDTRWPYGSYSTYFKPPPSPGCLPPPGTQIVPCPHQARHLLVSAATTRHVFGHMFANEFEDPKKMGVLRQSKIFDIMRTGYEALFLGKLNDPDQIYLDERIAELNTTVRESDAGENIGVQIRRGDCHPLEYQYQKSYIPLDKYLDTAYNLTSKSNSRILIASDDPQVYEDSISYTHAHPTPASIQEAQLAIPILTNPDQSATRGFTTPFFWSLGRHTLDSTQQVEDPNQNQDHASPSSSSSSSSSSSPSYFTLDLRSQLARSYLLDLAVLGQSSDRVVCAVSSDACRILAVMMGWERGIVEGGWINVDGAFEWRGVRW